MRVLDIGVSAGYALLCVSLIALMNPYSFEAARAGTSSDARASMAIASYVGDVGLAFLATAPPSDVCSSMLASSNSTVVLGGIVDGQVCGVAPSHPLGSSSFEISAADSTVEVEAWIAGP